MYERFLEILNELRISAYKVGVDTGISQQALSNWKTGKNKPSYRTMEKLANYFGVNIDWLYGTSDVKFLTPVPDYVAEMMQDEDVKIFLELKQKCTSGKRFQAYMKAFEQMVEAGEMDADR